MSSMCLVCAAQFDKDDFLVRYGKGAFDSVVAVDGGYKHLQEVGVVPDFALGDWDSLGFVPSDVPTYTHPVVKDATDLELALDYARRNGATTLFVYGCLSGRLDHTVAAMQTLAQASEEGFDVTAFVGDGSALRIITGPSSLFVDPSDSVKSHATVSVFAANDKVQGVTESGLLYSLDDVDMANRGSLGVSNELIGTPASISVQLGTLYVFLPADLV